MGIPAGQGEPARTNVLGAARVAGRRTAHGWEKPGSRRPRSPCDVAERDRPVLRRSGCLGELRVQWSRCDSYRQGARRTVPRTWKVRPEARRARVGNPGRRGKAVRPDLDPPAGQFPCRLALVRWDLELGRAHRVVCAGAEEDGAGAELREDGRPRCRGRTPAGRPVLPHRRVELRELQHARQGVAALRLRPPRWPCSRFRTAVRCRRSCAASRGSAPTGSASRRRWRGPSRSSR